MCIRDRTIISRCQRINFSALSPAGLEDILKKDYNFPVEESHYLSFSCEGRLGESLRQKDTNILREKNQILNEFLNLSGKGYFTEQIFEEKDKQKQLLLILMQWFRDMMLLKSGVDASGIINIDRKNDLLKLKERYSLEELSAALNDIIETHKLLEQNLNVKISLSLLREKLCKN
jgi:DNA polymerase-3 subunit delta'